MGGSAICPKLHGHFPWRGTLGTRVGVSGGEGSVRERYLRIRAGCVRPGAARPQERQRWRVGEVVLALVSEGAIRGETVVQHCFGLIPGKLSSFLHIQAQGAHMPENPMLWVCSQTRPILKAGIFEMLVALQAKSHRQAYAGPKQQEMCTPRPDRPRAAALSQQGADTEETGHSAGRPVSPSLLAWAP